MENPTLPTNWLAPLSNARSASRWVTLAQQEPRRHSNHPDFRNRLKTKECEKCLDSIANGNIKDHSFEAYYTLEEWKKGNLKFPYQEDWGK